MRSAGGSLELRLWSFATSKNLCGGRREILPSKLALAFHCPFFLNHQWTYMKGCGLDIPVPASGGWTVLLCLPVCVDGSWYTTASCTLCSPG